MAATTALREALNRGISSGNLIDTKIVLYSHRDPSGRVRRPKALYTNSSILKTVPYFNDLLFGNFVESQSKDFKEAIDEEESADDYGYLSDSDLEDDEDEKVSFKHTAKSEIQPFDPFAVSGEDKVTREDYEERVEKGKVVKIPDIAFVTFQAFLMYLYTDVIEFAPFGSDENRRSRRAEIVKSSGDKIPRPSPKSIYRLADKYDIPTLKTLALNHIRSELEKCDIVEESFSIFASQFDEVRNLYLEQLAFVWVGDSTAEAIRVKVEEKIDSFVVGDLEHTTDTFSALWEVANKDGDVKAPSIPMPTATPVTSPGHWASVNTALIKSIRKGVFFDRKYWARHSKGGNVLKPVYFSSIIMNDKAQQLSKLVKYLKNQDPLMIDLEGDVNIESDCDPIGPVGISYNPASGRSPLWGKASVVPAQPTSQSMAGPLGILQQFSMHETTGSPTPTKHTLEPTPTLGERRPASHSTPLATAPVKGEPKPASTSSKRADKRRAGPQERDWESVQQPTPEESVKSLENVAQEEDSLEVMDQVGVPQENEEQIRAVLITGSFSAWKSVFFYRCTDEVLFAPLKSQGVVSRLNYVREHTLATAPPPCSPKSVYVLADLLGITPLRTKALEDIKKKVTVKTVVGEVFSWVTAGQKEILEMECDLLVSNFKGQRTNALVKENIRNISDGSSSHCANAMKLGLEKAFKRRKQSNLVKLRCTHTGCTWYNNHITISTIGSGAYYCQMCSNRGWNHYFQCVECAYNRTSNYTSCQKCGKTFA